MRIEYFPDTDSLYIELANREGRDVVELSAGVVMDVDEHGLPVGLDIDQASKHLDLEHLDLSRLPFQIHQVA
jgi:uncharacterized protein YuzE